MKRNISIAVLIVLTIVTISYAIAMYRDFTFASKIRGIHTDSFGIASAYFGCGGLIASSWLLLFLYIKSNGNAMTRMA